MKAVNMVESLATAVENQIIQLKHTGKGQDQIRLPGMLMEKMGYLAGTIAIADFAPADQYVEVYDKLQGEWTAVQKSWEALKANEIAALRESLRSNTSGSLLSGGE